MPLQMNKNAENSLSGYYSEDQFHNYKEPRMRRQKTSHYLLLRLK